MTLSTSRALHVRLTAFEGPLDLLLHLIRKNQVDIYDIPIAQIAQQYLDYLALWESLDLAIAGEYIVMAATLLEIKSRMLLPSAPAPEGEEEAEDPRAELVQRLLDYQRYQGMVETLREWEEYRRQIYFRAAQEGPDDYLLPVEEGALQAAQLLAALRRVLSAAGVDAEPVTAVVPRRRVGLRLKMAELLKRVQRHPEGIGFEALFTLPCERYEIVMIFLSLLELLRLGRVRVEQEEMLGEITIYPQEAAP